MNSKHISKITITLTISTLIVIQTACSYFQSDPTLSSSDNMEKEISQIINRLYDNGQFSGVVLVSVKENIIYKNAVGYANLEDSIPNTFDTKFRIASFTKPFTAMLILQLEEDGKLELDGKLIAYLPEFTIEKSEEITIRQLLTHTAGITGESRIPNLIDIEKLHYTREELLNCIKQYDLVYEPGSRKEYSNFGYALLGLVIERVSGKPYDEVLYEKVCKPSGMENTLSDITEQPIDKRGIGYTYDYFTGIENASFLDMSFCLGAGQLLSTVEDLYLFDKALYTDIFFKEKQNKQLFYKYGGYGTIQYPYGLGSKIIKSNCLDGSINGFQSHNHRIEKDTVFIVALRNVKESVYENEIVIKWPSSMITRILAVLYGEEYDFPKKSGAFVIFKTLLDSGEVIAANLYKEMKKNQSDKYYLDEREFAFFTEEFVKAEMEKQALKYQEIWKEI